MKESGLRMSLSQLRDSVSVWPRLSLSERRLRRKSGLTSLVGYEKIGLAPGEREFCLMCLPFDKFGSCYVYAAVE